MDQSHLLIEKYYSKLKFLPLKELRNSQILLSTIDSSKENKDQKRERRAIEMALAYAVLDKIDRIPE